MVEFSNVNFSYKAGDFKQNAANMAGSAAKAAGSALVKSLIFGGAAAEVADSGARTAKAEAESAQVMSEIGEGAAECSQLVQKIVDMVKSGEIEISQFKNLLTVVIASMNDYNAQAETANEKMEALKQENDELIKEIADLNAEISNPEELAKDDNSKRDAGENPNKDKLNQLMSKLKSNNEMIAVLQDTLAQISQKQSESVQAGQELQAQTEQAFNKIGNEVIDYAKQKFDEIGTKLKGAATKGTKQQTERVVEGTTYEAADASAAAAKATEATGEGVGAAFTLGITGALAAKAATEAGLFTSASGVNAANIGSAAGHMAAIKAGEQAMGQYISSQISTMINQQIQGAFTQLTNQILGEDVASHVNPIIQQIIEQGIQGENGQ